MGLRAVPLRPLGAGRYALGLDSRRTRRAAAAVGGTGLRAGAGDLFGHRHRDRRRRTGSRISRALWARRPGFGRLDPAGPAGGLCSPVPNERPLRECGQFEQRHHHDQRNQRHERDDGKQLCEPQCRDDGAGDGDDCVAADRGQRAAGERTGARWCPSGACRPSATDLGDRGCDAGGGTSVENRTAGHRPHGGAGTRAAAARPGCRAADPPGSRRASRRASRCRRVAGRGRLAGFKASDTGCAGPSGGRWHHCWRAGRAGSRRTFRCAGRAGCPTAADPPDRSA